MRSVPTAVIICGTDKSVPYTQIIKLQFDEILLLGYDIPKGGDKNG